MRTVRRRVEPDQDAAAVKLQDPGINPWNKPTIITPAEAERRLPKARHAQLEPLVEKPIGELTVAAASDPKPAVAVTATLRAALQSSIAAGYLQSSQDKLAKGGRR